MTVGQRIKKARERAGITQVELGEKIGVSGVAIMRYEKDQRQPRIEQFQAIAIALGVDVNWLMNGYTLEQRDQAMKDYVARRFTEAELDKRLWDSYGAMTVEGKGKVVDYAEDILLRYRAEMPSQPPPAPPEGQIPPSPQRAQRSPQTAQRRRRRGNRRDTVQGTSAKSKTFENVGKKIAPGVTQGETETDSRT